MNRLTMVCTLAFCLFVVFCGPVLSQVRAERMPPAPKMLERPNVAEFREPSVEPGREVVAVEMAWQKREPRDVARRLEAAIRALLGEEASGRLSKQITYDALVSIVAGEAAGSWARLTHTPILVRYDPLYDELRVIHEELDVVGESARDVGIEGARDVAERTLTQLAKFGVIDSRLYSQAAIQVGYKMVGEGPVDQKVKPGRVVGYRVTYRPRLRGFQVANAGLRLGITASGEVDSLRVGGVTPHGEWRGDVFEPTKAGGVRKARVGTKELMERFYRQAAQGADSRVAWSRIMYVMPENMSSAVLEPMLVISATHVFQTADGPVASRRKTLAYSLTNPKAPPIDFDVPVVRHEGTEPIRKE